MGNVSARAENTFAKKTFRTCEKNPRDVVEQSEIFFLGMRSFLSSLLIKRIILRIEQYYSVCQVSSSIIENTRAQLTRMRNGEVTSAAARRASSWRCARARHRTPGWPWRGSAWRSCASPGTCGTASRPPPPVVVLCTTQYVVVPHSLAYVRVCYETSKSSRNSTLDRYILSPLSPSHFDDVRVGLQGDDGFACGMKEVTDTYVQILYYLVDIYSYTVWEISQYSIFYVC